MTTLQLLELGRARVAKGWCQRTSARNADLTPTSNRGESADLLCAAAAVEYDTNCEIILEKVIRKIDLVVWNDTPGRTQAEVVAAFDRANELARTAERNGWIKAIRDSFKK